ncbi:PREDICTED: F-box/kelch-repeat protein At4g23580-like [Camelina sativa]|uniref:F-box/kelch-repeat protein At4g23580-like n=1 Tax=Camelina sativa TaxID=90675 RepID=A0ABM0UKC0_CAMSA|nr:PREDICTED: F-box/kelch-repeat protein At4g23580-like [Camelina sativa]
MNTGEELSLKKWRPPTIMMLPDDLILNCLARVSRLYYPTLSLVSKKFRSILTSTELYQTRTLLGRTENCLYVCLQSRNDYKTLRWFTLCLRPNSSKKVLVPIFYLDSPYTSRSNVAMLGSDIYVIGGDKNYSSNVMVIDCRSHTLREAPSTQVARVFPSACVVDEKVFVLGGRENLDSTNWLEVFDTKTQTWEFLQIPSKKLCSSFRYNSVGYEGTIYVRSNYLQDTYKLHKGRWRTADLAIDTGWTLASSYCVIENVFYRYKNMTIDWYDHKEKLWTTLKGLEKLPTCPRIRNGTLVDYGGKMVVLWEEYVYDKNHEYEKTIWCAEIAIERRQNGEIWGTINWFDVVFTTNEPYSLVHALATSTI